MRRHSQYTLKKASEHIYYEAWMFLETSKRLGTSSSLDNATINILLDAFAIHTRNLFEFLYPKQGNALKRKPPAQSDIVVTDYIEKLGYYRTNRTKKSELDFVWKKTNKQVSHLTYTRNRYSSKTKPWPFLDVKNKMHKTLCAFYDSLPKDQKEWPYFKELKEVLGI